jgi:tetratricopeptide (TPR) repeat protein
MAIIEKSEPVKVWTEDIILPTYPAANPDPNPMFFEHRNIQGAKGNVYPAPFTDQLTSVKVNRKYKAVYLENEYIQIILLPEIGGRIFAGLDKTNGYDFFYRHTVIKPALIGVYGPWISGGVEFNWPQHHRPTTFDPVDLTLEKHSDGSKTIWLSEHDPFNRTKGMVGVCLHPAKAIVETKVRLFNRTSIPHTFLWWENTGVHIHEKYQVIFPPDVHWVVYHAKAAVSTYPFGRGVFHSNDYGDGKDLSWYINSPNATSFFAGDSKYDFFGGYDHAKDCGVVHVANHYISPGKKFFTWGSGRFGEKWQQNLMDDEGPYLELMAGVYTDNQPDFSWIVPYETKTFSQYWYPVQKIGPMKNANTRAALNLTLSSSELKNEQVARLGVYATEEMTDARIILSSSGKTLLEKIVNLKPGAAFLDEISLPMDIPEISLHLQLVDQNGDEIIGYQPESPWNGNLPEPYQPPASPQEIASVEELYLTGLHLEQYRHPFISAIIYWEEALRRDPEDSRTNIAMGRDAFRRGELDKAEEHFRTAIRRLTSRNFNPYDSEVYYFLGLTLQSEDRLDEAYHSFYKATWDNAWKSAAFYRLALIDTRRGDITKTMEHLEQSLRNNMDNNKVRCLKSAILRHMGQLEEADALICETIIMDPLDTWARHEHLLIARESGLPRIAQQRLDDLHEMMRGDVQTYLDVALDYASAGLYEDTFPLIGFLATDPTPYPMVAYVLGYFAKQMGQIELCKEWYQKGANASPEFCFPWRLEEKQVLEDVLEANPEDAYAHYYLGNLLYDKKQFSKAVEHWKSCTSLKPGFAIPWRNLALAAYNLDRDIDQALTYIQKAFESNPNDPRILLEYDQLLYRKACPPEKRLALLEQNIELVNQRDDLVSQRIMLHNCVGKPEKALEFASQRTFHPWEGGEGSVSEHYANAHWILGREALDAGNGTKALQHFLAGQEIPDNLGEVPADFELIHLIYYTALAYELLNEPESASEWFQKILDFKAGPSITAYYKGLAYQKLGNHEAGENLLREMLRNSEKMAENPPGPGYFYYGNPNPVFEDDPKKLQRTGYLLMAGMARLGLGDKMGARSVLGQVLALDPTRLFAHEEYKRL